MTDCIKCKTKDGISFECKNCCVRWLKSMSSNEYRKTNAPVIEAIKGKEFLDQVREAYKND